MLKIYKIVFLFSVNLCLLGLLIPQAFSNQKYDEEDNYNVDTREETAAKYDEVVTPPPSLHVLPEKVAVESVDSWFNGSSFDFSLDKLRSILPSYIQVTPESRLMGEIHCRIEGFLKISVDVDASISGIALNHRGLAAHTVYIPDLSLKGKIFWDHYEKTISFENLSLGRAFVKAQISGMISYKELTALKLNVVLPDTDIQKILDALPHGLIPEIKGAQVLGTLGGSLVFEADPQHPELAKIEPDLRVSNYSLLTQPAGIHIRELNGEYTHAVKKNGEVVRHILLSKNNPDFVPYDQLGEKIRQAIIRSEDGSFLINNGFNLDELRQALYKSLSAKGFVRGGSTITMQLAKNLFLNGERTLSRKLQESLLTFALEKELSKERIFEIYANIIEWGVDVYGVSEATQHYFSKTPSAVSSEEAARLASIIPSPKKRDFNRKDLSTVNKLIGQLDY